MNPFFFGTADHRLFGVYQPSRRPAGRSGVVLCYPWGHEYVPAHQALEKDANSEGDTLEDRGLALTPEARAEFEAITPALYARLRLPMLVIVTQGAAAGVEQALRPGPEGDHRVDVESVEGASPWM